MADGAAAGPAVLQASAAARELQASHRYPAVRAELLARLDRGGEAAAAYRVGIDLVTAPAERRFLLRRLDEITSEDRFS